MVIKRISQALSGLDLQKFSATFGIFKGTWPKTLNISHFRETNQSQNSLSVCTEYDDY